MVLQAVYNIGWMVLLYLILLEGELPGLMRLAGFHFLWQNVISRTGIGTGVWVLMYL